MQGELQSSVNWDSILNSFARLTYCQCVTFMVTAKASIRAALGDTVILATKEKRNIISRCLFQMGLTRCYTLSQSNEMLQMVTALQRAKTEVRSWV